MKLAAVLVVMLVAVGDIQSVSAEQAPAKVYAVNNPTKDGKLDIWAFTPGQWLVVPNRTPWMLGGESNIAILYYSYSSFLNHGRPETHVAVKLAVRGENGGFSRLTITSGQIDCSQPGVYPRVIYHALDSSYAPDTGQPLQHDNKPRDIPLNTEDVLATVTRNVCDQVNGIPVKHRAQ